MKKILRTLALLILSISLLCPTTTKGAIEAADARINSVAMFFNQGETPANVPFMVIVFHGVKKSDLGKIQAWRTEISKKISELGGVHEEADHQKIKDTLSPYLVEFLTIKMVGLVIEFPKEKPVQK